MEKKQECGFQPACGDLKGRKHPGSAHDGEKRVSGNAGGKVCTVEQTLCRGQAALPALVCYFSLCPEGTQMPGPLLIQESRKGNVSGSSGR